MLVLCAGAQANDYPIVTTTPLLSGQKRTTSARTEDFAFWSNSDIRIGLPANPAEVLLRAPSNHAVSSASAPTARSSFRPPLVSLIKH
jgi:hypothetical protein